MSGTERELSGFVTEGPDGGHHLDLAVEGMYCAACMVKIEDGICALPGVTRARVNLTSRRLSVDWTDAEFNPSTLLQRLARLGYRAHPFDPAREEQEEAIEAKRLLRYLAVAAFASMNIMLLSVSVWSGNVSDITEETRDFFHWVSALIALPTAAYAGQPFFESAMRALRARSLNMDVPISLGVLLALGLSVVETLQHATHAYFDSAVMLLTFLLVGRFLDQNMRRRTRDVAQNLAALKGETASVVLPDGTAQEMPLSRIVAGALVLVRPGERISIDGVVEEGTSNADQSLVTGETDPVALSKGAPVYAGTVNGEGLLHVRVSAAAKGTFLDEVTRLLDTAVESRSRYMRLADRASRAYAPVVHVTALLTTIGWLLAGYGLHHALVTAIAVLIITCPCALGLAIPAVQVVSSGALFKRGVLLNSGDAIERLAEADTIVFDKTGTLTLPGGVVSADTAGEAGLLFDAAQLAAGSSHPLARALARSVPGVVPLAGIVEETGRGVRAEVEGVMWRLGSAAYCGADRQLADVQAQHPEASFIAFVRGDAAPHIFAIRQGLRPDAVVEIERLKAMGFAIEILSGDRPDVVARTAQALGITAFAGGCRPQDKITRLDALKSEGRKVLMVGDGLNDAPALAAAHVAMSPVTASHLSQAAADAVFLGDQLAPVRQAIALARRARQLMVQNLWLAVVYNAIAVPVAIAGLATPLVAALAMSGSSIIVTLNALRARFGIGEIE